MVTVVDTGAVVVVDMRAVVVVDTGAVVVVLVVITGTFPGTSVGVAPTTVLAIMWDRDLCTTCSTYTFLARQCNPPQ
jgi:hypothetical protein